MKKIPLIQYIIFLVSIVLILNIHFISVQAYSSFNPENLNQESFEIEEYKIFYVIGIGIYWPYQGTWPAINQISPILFLIIGSSRCEIVGIFSSSSIDFIDGDKFIGFYPFWVEFRNMIFFSDIPVNGIGIICGIWLDKQ